MPPRNALALLLGGWSLLSATVRPTTAFPINETSHLNVYIPTSLHKNSTNGIPHKMANFGEHPSYGSLSLPVYFYFEICEFPVDTSKGYPPRGKDTKGQQLRWEPPFILMAPRGGCSFTTKARHAQMAGASAIVVADTTCLCSDANCLQNNTWKSGGDNGTQTCQQYEPVMADDGSGGDVTIPGFLLYKDDAVPIKEAIVDKGESVLMGMRWHKPQNDSVHWGIWMDILDDHTTSMLVQQVGPIVNSLGDRGHFFPHYMLHNGTRTNCGGDQENDLCQGMCTNNGRYCVATHHYNGTAVVLEILRRSCILSHHGVDKDGVAHKWWNYQAYFVEYCKAFTDQKCIHEAYKHAEINKDEIENCMKDTGDPTGDEPNTLLDAELRAQIEYGVTMAPTIWVNHKIMKDPSPSAEALFQSICEVNVPGSEFKVCKQCLDNKDPVGCVRKKYSKAPSKKKFHYLLWSGFLASLGLFLFAYKRYQEGEGASFPGLSSMSYAMLRDGEDHGFQSPTQL